MRRAQQLSFISEFTDDVAHIKEDDNVVQNALPRIEINQIVFPQTKAVDIDYAEIAEAQLEDDYVQSMVDGSENTSLQLKEFPVGDGMNTIICDTLTSKARPIILKNFQKLIFDTIPNMSHHGIKGTKKLIQHRFVWHEMNKDITSWVRNCPECQKGKILRQQSTN